MDAPYSEYAPKQLCIKTVFGIFSGGQRPSTEQAAPLRVSSS
jgi:hypothetical protein